MLCSKKQKCLHSMGTRSNVLIPSVPLFQGFPSAYYFHNFNYETSSCMCIYYCFIICAIPSYPLCGSRWLIFQESGHPCHLRRVNGPQASHGLICYTRRSSLLPGTLSPLPGSHKLLRARPSPTCLNWHVWALGSSAVGLLLCTQSSVVVDQQLLSNLHLLNLLRTFALVAGGLSVKALDCGSKGPGVPVSL